jgi:DNA modification methylase
VTFDLHAYEQFLESKMAIAPRLGLDCDPSEVNPILKPHQRDAVVWAVRGGRRALFEAFGLGKTMQQLEIVRIILNKIGGNGLIVCPLGVRQEFKRDADTLGIPVQFVRSDNEVDYDLGEPSIYLTNYESIREKKLNPAGFKVISLDEAAILRGFGGTKTFRSLMQMFEGSATYRFVATATPSPNEYIELLAYAAFLDIMDVSQAKTRFFKRDSTQADKLTLLAHKEREFWAWCASWALFLQKPSDLGYSDEGYTLPDLDIRWHEIPTDHSRAGYDSRSGQGRLIQNTTISVTNQAKEKRESLAARILKMTEIISGQTHTRIPARVLREEQGTSQQEATEGLLRSSSEGEASSPNEGLESEQPGQVEGVSAAVQSVDQIERTSPDENAAAKKLRSDGRGLPPAVGSTVGTVRNMRTTAEAGEEVAHRPRSRDRSSQGTSVREMQHGARPDGRQCQINKENAEISEQWVIWCSLNEEQEAAEIACESLGLSVASLYGSTPLEEREALLECWKAGQRDVLITKPVMYGAGVNLQQSHKAIFVGIGFKFSEFIQACKRQHRFLQRYPVEIHLVYTEAEREVRRTLQRKWEQHDQLVGSMSEIIREYGLAGEAINSLLSRSIGCERREFSGSSWKLVNNDSVLETAAMPDDSVGLILTSIPFSTQYEYSPNYNDFGANENNEAFWHQMDFLTTELLRVLQPGRVCAIHVKDRVTPSGLTGLGFQTVQPFHAQAIFHYQKHGFAYMGMKTIVTDVVRENNQTYRLGWTEQCKDGTKMGFGMPEYLLLFRKPTSDATNGYADEPVVKTKPLCDDHGSPLPFDPRSNWKQPIPGTGYSRAKWQFDAHGFNRQGGDRLLSSEELRTLPHEKLFKLWRDRSLKAVHDHKEHVAIAEELDHEQRLPATFMLLPPHSWHPDVWTDITRMRTLNMMQEQKGQQMHLCPLQFDIVERVIEVFSMKGETVFDPFAGLGTVPMMAVKMGRYGIGSELAPGYFADSVLYLRQAEAEASIPTLFDLVETID